jgi:hypothetical protein
MFKRLRKWMGKLVGKEPAPTVLTTALDDQAFLAEHCSITVSKETYENFLKSHEPAKPKLEPLVAAMVDCPTCGGRGYTGKSFDVHVCPDCRGLGQMLYKTGQ